MIRKMTSMSSGMRSSESFPFALRFTNLIASPQAKNGQSSGSRMTRGTTRLVWSWQTSKEST